jgi:hypothetical protein
MHLARNKIKSITTKKWGAHIIEIHWTYNLWSWSLRNEQTKTPTERSLNQKKSMRIDRDHILQKNQDLPSTSRAIIEPITGSPSKQSIHHVQAQLHGAIILADNICKNMYANNSRHRRFMEISGSRMRAQASTIFDFDPRLYNKS